MRRIRNIATGRLAETLATLTDDERNRAGMQFSGIIGENCTIQIWPNRTALTKTIRMQEQRERRSTDWKPVIALQVFE